MDYSISIDEQSNIVFVDVEGEQTADEIFLVMTEAVNLGREKDCYKFLLDMQESTVVDSIWETFDFVKRIKDMGFVPTDRIACVYHQQSEKHMFAQVAAQNRGWVIVYNRDRSLAIDWLKRC